MLKNLFVSLAVMVTLGGVTQTRVASAGDDIWDLMNPAWWMDRIDDDDDDEDWRYWRHAPGPYDYGYPYRWGYPPPGFGYPPPPQNTKTNPPELPLPE